MNPFSLSMKLNTYTTLHPKMKLRFSTGMYWIFGVLVSIQEGLFQGPFFFWSADLGVAGVRVRSGHILTPCRAEEEAKEEEASPQAGEVVG